MRKAIGTLVGAALAVFVLAALGVLSAADIPGEILFDNQGYKAKKMGPVRFGHQEHAEDYDLSCKTCHHVYQEGEKAEEADKSMQKCSACHGIQEKIGDAMRLPNAFHQKCRGCHKEVMGEKGECSDCHQEKS